ncbi:MAG: hypothetical protein ACLUIW_00770 [Dysosmobacter welbionis]
MKLVILLAVIAGKWLLCLWSGLGLVFLLFWLKGKQFRGNSEKWDDFFHPAAAKGGAVRDWYLSGRRAALVRHQLLCPEMGGLPAQSFDRRCAVCGRSLDYRVPVVHKKAGLCAEAVSGDPADDFGKKKWRKQNGWTDRIERIPDIRPPGFDRDHPGDVAV